MDHQVHLKPDMQHTHHQLNRLPLDKKQVFRHQVDDVYRKNIIVSIHESENVPKTSPIVLVLKQLSTGTNDLPLSYYRFGVTSKTLILFRKCFGTKFLTYGHQTFTTFFFIHPTMFCICGF